MNTCVNCGNELRTCGKCGFSKVYEEDMLPLKYEIEQLRKYAGFLRSVVRCGQSLPDDYDIATFTKEALSNADG